MTEPLPRLGGREPLPTRAEPTHILHIEIPMCIDEGKTFYFDPIQDAMRTVLAISRLATIGILCGSPKLTIEEPVSDEF